MAEGIETMILAGLAAPALGAQERSDEAPSTGAIALPGCPDPEVLAKHNPAMAEARVEFKQMFGGKLEHATGR